MSEQPEALRLAEAITDYSRYASESEKGATLRRMSAHKAAAAELRRQHAFEVEVLKSAKPYVYGRSDQLQKVAQGRGPFLCSMYAEPRNDLIALYTHPAAPGMQLVPVAHTVAIHDAIAAGILGDKPSALIWANALAAAKDAT
jgi:hypothetical protein